MGQHVSYTKQHLIMHTEEGRSNHEGRADGVRRVAHVGLTATHRGSPGWRDDILGVLLEADEGSVLLLGRGVAVQVLGVELLSLDALQELSELALEIFDALVLLLVHDVATGTEEASLLGWTRVAMRWRRVCDVGRLLEGYDNQGTGTAASIILLPSLLEYSAESRPHSQRGR